MTPAVADGATPTQLTVNASHVIGRIKSLTGVTGSYPDKPSVMSDFQRAGVTTWRTHDTGAIDLMSSSAPQALNSAFHANVIFPDPTANPSNPLNYHFSGSDRIMKAIVSGGMVPYLRVGDSHDGLVPPSYRIYGQVVQHVVEHYMDGWDHGYHMTLKYFEFWNEPDIPPIPAIPPAALGMWDGTPDQLFKLYGVVAKAIRSVDPKAIVGGPAVAINTPSYELPFLKYVKEHNLPLDFFSYHWYDVGENNPYNYIRISDELERDARAVGIKRLPLVLSEWGDDINDVFNPPLLSTKALAAFEGASLAYMQDTPIVQQYLEAIPGIIPLYNGSGTSGLSAAGRVYEANASLQATPARLAVTGTDNKGLTVLAGRATKSSTDTPDEMRILITNYEIPKADRGPLTSLSGLANVWTTPIVINTLCYVFLPSVCQYQFPRANPTYANNTRFNVTIDHLPSWAGRGAILYQYKLDSAHDMSLVGKKTFSSREIRLGVSLPAPAVELMVIRPRDAGQATLHGVWRNDYTWH